MKNEKDLILERIATRFDKNQQIKQNKQKYKIDKVSAEKIKMFYEKFNEQNELNEKFNQEYQKIKQTFKQTL